MKEILGDILGDVSPLSALAAAAKLGFDGAVAMSELADASEADANGPFTPLSLNEDGSGGFRVDRFRRYFFQQGGAELPIVDLFADFGRIFPQYVNGTGDEVDEFESIEENISTVFFRKDRQFNNEVTMQFLLDARVLFQFVDAPDLHDDWVGFVHQDGVSFCVNTLKRHFSEGKDVEFAVAVHEALLAAGVAGGGLIGGPIGAVAGGGVGFFAGIAGGVTAAALNRSHFLAGRRSWCMGTLPPFEVTNFPGSAFHISFIETAAVDRFSSWVVDLATMTDDVGLGDVDEQTARIWPILLRNYRPVDMPVGFRTDISGFEDEILERAGPTFARREQGIFIDQREFDSLQVALSQDWVQEILRLHPGIRSMVS